MGSENISVEKPQVVAAVDIGSNSIRMTIAEINGGGNIRVLEQMRRAVRLGHDTFLSGSLSRKTMNAAITILRDYRTAMDTYRVEHITAVATSAVRESSNSDAFLDWISRDVGLDVRVIEPSEESRLMVSAVCNVPPCDISEHTALITEVGGGSVWMAIFKDGHVQVSASYDIGSVRLQEVLATSSEPIERAVELLRSQIRTVAMHMQRSLPLESVDCFIAVGGDARFAAAHLGKMQLGITEPVTLLEFDNLVDQCVLYSASQLARRYAIPFADAETLVPALLTYQAMVRMTKAQSITVSSVSLRDGLLLDTVHTLTGRGDELLAEGIIESVKTLGRKYQYDTAHAEHVAMLAISMFDQLKTLHGLGSRQRLLLKVAGLLHDIGAFVGPRAHHKHSFYLIGNSEIFGLSREEMMLIAHIARYHRRNTPRASHLEYMALRREQRIVINKLAGILRIADALDRSHTQSVANLHLNIKPNEVIVSVTGKSELTAEKRALAQKVNLFEDTYGLKVVVEVVDLAGYGIGKLHNNRTDRHLDAHDDED
jgi:exopolyphosphatase/guanosine-5'-triphosphate,3'-diphosphate pyrophosphatase